MCCAALLLPLLVSSFPGGDKTALPESYQGLAKSARTKLDRIWGTGEQHVLLMNRVAYTPDGKTALVASAAFGEKDADDFIAVWDLDKAEVRRTLVIKKATATAIAVAPDGKHAITAAVPISMDDVRVQYWNLDTGKIIHQLPGAAHAVALSPDGKRALAGGSSGQVLVFDMVAGKLLQTLTDKGGVQAVAISADGKQALTGGLANQLRLWNLDTGKQTADLFAQQNWISAVAFLPGGKRAVSVGANQVPKLWDLQEKKLIRDFKTQPLGTGPTPLALSTDGKHLVSLRTPYNQALNAIEDFVTCWDVDSGKELWSTKVHLPVPTPLAFIGDNKTVLLGGGESFFMHLDAATGKVQKMWGGHRGAVVALALEPKGGRFWTASGDRTVKQWSSDSKNELFTLHGHDDVVTSLAVVGDTLLTASGDKTMKLWQLGTEKLLRTFTGHTEGITGLAISKSGKHAVTGSSDRSIKLWDIASAKNLKTFTGHSHAVTSVAISADGKWAASGSDDKTVRLWYLPDDMKDVEPMVLEGHSREVTAVVFTPDAKHVLSASQDQTVRIWDAGTGKEVRQFKGHKNWVTSLAVLAEAKLLVTVCDDLTVKLWNLETGKEVDSLDFGAASDVAKAVAATPDGRGFLVGTANWLVLRFTLRD
jgi:WD40 repeat protein